VRGKNCTYRQQNHLPLMIVHPAYPGGKTCKAVTSQVDLAPTLLALTGADPAALKRAGTDLAGRNFSACSARRTRRRSTRCGRRRCCYNMLSSGRPMEREMEDHAG
jgi:arylsulfatase A-like enzyme